MQRVSLDPLLPLMQPLCQSHCDLNSALRPVGAGPDLDSKKTGLNRLRSHLNCWDPSRCRCWVSPRWIDCPAYLTLRPLRSTATHQFRHIGHWVWLAIGDGASAQVKPALGVSFGLHAFGDGLPVVDFGLIHGEQIKNLRNPSEPETVQLSVCSSACRPGDPKNPVMLSSVRMTGDRWR